MPVYFMEQARRGRPDEGGKEEGRAYYGHTQGAYGAEEPQDESLTIRIYGAQRGT